MPLSKNQRESILQRDSYTSQLWHYSEEKGWYQSEPSQCRQCHGEGCPLQVHHITPQRYSHAVLGLLESEIDTPYNLITLFECEHTGKMPGGEVANPETDFVVHFDQPAALLDYRAGNLHAFLEMFAMRDLLTDQGQPYWNTAHDDYFRETARINTDNAVTQYGWTFPVVHHRAKK